MEEKPEPIYTGTIVPPSSQGSGVIVGDCVLLILTTLWTALRIFSRKQKRVPLLIEDYLHLGALLCFYGTFAVSILMVLNGLGQHTPLLSPSHIMTLLKLSFVSQVLYAVSLGLIKISICWTLSRIFVIPTLIIISRILMGFSFAWAVMTILIGILICQPVEMNWNPQTPGGHCGNQNAAYSAVGVVDIVVDFAILLLPIPTVLKLQLPTANRIGLMFVFSFGILTMVFGAIRLAAVTSVNFTDFSYSARMSHIWSVAENGVAVALVVSSSPFLRPLFDRVFKNVLTWGSQKISKNSSGYADNNQGSGVPKRSTGYFERLHEGTEMNPVAAGGSGNCASVPRAWYDDSDSAWNVTPDDNSSKQIVVSERSAY